MSMMGILAGEVCWCCRKSLPDVGIKPKNRKRRSPMRGPRYCTKCLKDGRKIKHRQLVRK